MSSHIGAGGRYLVSQAATNNHHSPEHGIDVALAQAAFAKMKAQQTIAWSTDPGTASTKRTQSVYWFVKDMCRKLSGYGERLSDGQRKALIRVLGEEKANAVIAKARARQQENFKLLELPKKPPGVK